MNDRTDAPIDSGDQGFQARWQQLADRLLFARGTAIDAYAAVEQQLMNVFSALLDIEQEQGALVFYRIVSAHARNAMMKDLILSKHGDSYKSYWTSMLGLIAKLDQKRNEIVHWHLGGNLALGANEPALNRPKDFWPNGGAALTLAEIEEFIRRANFVVQSLAVFWLWAHGPLADAEGTTWQDTFSGPVVYPPPPDHPLHRLTQEFGNRFPSANELDKRVGEFKLMR